MLGYEFLLSIVFILALVSLISVLFTDKKLIFAILAIGFMVGFYLLSQRFDNVEAIPLLAFIMGITLISLEVYIPSFGLIGISGLIIGGYGLFRILDAGGDTISLMVLAGITIVVTEIVYVRSGFRMNIFDKQILNDPNSSERGFNSKEDFSSLVGKVGVANTALRPSGRVEIEENYYDALSRSEFIKKGSSIEVVGVKDRNIIVKEI